MKMKKIIVMFMSMVAFVVAGEIGVVYGLDPNNEGFLSLRTASKQQEIAKLYNGDKVEILETQGKWYRVVAIKSSQVGWAFGDYIKSSTHSTAQKGWLDPTRNICTSKGGKISSDGVCEADWHQAKKICKAMGGRLPTIEELRRVITGCGGVVDSSESNKKNSNYQSCYQNKGFTASNRYWSATTGAGDTSNAWHVYFDDGTDYWYGKGDSGSVRCVR